jgi:hypothetical protein
VTTIALATATEVVSKQEGDRFKEQVTHNDRAKGRNNSLQKHRSVTRQEERRGEAQKDDVAPASCCVQIVALERGADLDR